MYVIRRMARTQPGKAWEVASHLVKITQAYEEAGLSPTQVYISLEGLPGTPVVYAQWLQEDIEPTDKETVFEAIRTNDPMMHPLITEYSREYYELVTPEKLDLLDLA